MVRRSGSKWFLCVSIAWVFCGVTAQTSEIQSGSYFNKHLKQAAEYQAAQDLLAQQPELYDAFSHVTGWMFERTKPRAAERREA